MAKTSKTSKTAKGAKAQATKVEEKKPTSKPAKAETPKTEKAEVARDRFGCREGSQSATINAALTSKPQASTAIAEATGLNSARVRAHLKYLVAKELIAETDEGFALKPAKGKK
jgi:hypothetical protein